MSGKSRVTGCCRQVLLGTFLAAFAAASCGKSNESGGTGGSGGTTGQGGSGGTSASGGSGSGGAAGSGGAGSGGTTATGGSTSSGGAAGSGGASGGSGGVAGSGGSGSGGVSNTGGSGTTASGGKVGSGGATTGGAGGVGTGGSTSRTDAGAGGATGGTSQTGTGGNTSASGGSTGKGGATGTGGSTGGGGSCAGRAVSLSANGSASDSDSAYAHVEIDLKTDLPIANTKRTVEFWAFIKTTDWVGEKNQVYYYGDGSGSNTSFGLDFGTNAVTGSTANHATLNPFTGSDIRDDSGKDLGITSSADQWVHIAMTWDGTVLTTYVNGAAKITVQGSGSATTLNTKQSILMLGCNPTNNNCFNGIFDELRVWNVARSATEIKDNYNKPLAGSEAGLVGYWKFDEASGTTAADAVTITGHTAHTGTLKADTATHNPTFVTPTVPVPLVCP